MKANVGMNVGASGNSASNALAMFRQYVQSYARIGGGGYGHNFHSIASNIRRQMQIWKRQAATGNGATSALLRQIRAGQPGMSSRPKFLVNRDIQSRRSRVNILV